VSGPIFSYNISLGLLAKLSNGASPPELAVQVCHSIDQKKLYAAFCEVV